MHCEQKSARHITVLLGSIVLGVLLADDKSDEMNEAMSERFVLSCKAGFLEGPFQCPIMVNMLLMPFPPPAGGTPPGGDPCDELASLCGTCFRRWRFKFDGAPLTRLGKLLG